MIQAIFPLSQLFGFTGTPIFEANITRVTVAGENASLLTTEDVFQRQLHVYTITHAIEDKNVLNFYVNYFRVEGASLLAQDGSKMLPLLYPRPPSPSPSAHILDKDDVATHAHRSKQPGIMRKQAARGGAALVRRARRRRLVRGLGGLGRLVCGG